MFKYIEKLRSKPEHVRRRILVFSVSGIMFFIIIIWAVSIPVRFDVFRKTESGENYIPSPFSIVNNYVIDTKSNVLQSVNILKNFQFK